MKPFYQKLIPAAEQSLIFNEEELPHFVVPWHYHHEIEILMVIKSTGMCYIGDSFKDFSAGDVYLIGENLPHWWKSDDEYLQKGSTLNMKAHVIQFRKEIFESMYIPLPEMAPVRQLVDRSQLGIRFLGDSRIKIGQMIQDIIRSEGLGRVARLLLLLEMMANATEYEYLASVSFAKNVFMNDFHRFNKVHEYLIHNFTEPLRLEDVAAKAHLVPTAFSRYFKKCTGKSFSIFLNELRVGHAKVLLAENKNKISYIANECGFYNLSNFNEQFKKITGITPREYRERFNL
jgi:AraC-like DNA-binding protein